MRVSRNEQGNFFVDDEPMRLEGQDAVKFLTEMKNLDSATPDASRARFLEECVEAHNRTQRSAK